jgi:hypothetical protein
MANKILIKRSTANAVVTGLSNGELAFTQAGSKLFIGAPDGSGVIAIGGAHNPGVLTANQALVANSTSGIDKIIVANAAVTAVYANGSIGSAGQFLTSNGSVVYWSTAITTTNLTYSSNATTVTIASSTGDNAIILAANSTVAGVISAADKSKLDGIEAGAQANVPTNLGTTANTTTRTVTSSTGTDVILPAANSTQAGVMLSTDKTKLDGIAANAQPGTVTSVATGNGLSGGPITTTGTISVVANNGLSANATGIYVVGGNGLISNTTGVHVGAANGISVTADAVGVQTGSTLTVNTSGVHVNTSLSITDLTLSGNLVVNGTLTTIDTDNLSVEDSLIQIARNNTSTDSLDIGVYGSFGATGAKYTGVFRDATDGKWKFFTGLTVAPNSTVDTANASFAIATIVANLESANVQITGGSITGITDLSVADGGTGRSTFTTNGVIYGNGTTGLLVTAAGTNGQVLQANASGVPVFADLDGGTF